jgi:Response regulator of the LytR/AlgR family
MNIAIVDDEKSEFQRLDSMLKAYASDNRFNIKTTYFAGGEALLDVHTPGIFDVIFLDIYMDGMNGIEVARKVCDTDSQCQVVFLTTSKEHIWQAASLHGFDYILKDQLTEVRVFTLLEDLRKKFHYYDCIISFDTGSVNVQLKTNDIESITSNDNYTIFTMVATGEERHRIQFSRIAEMLSINDNFLHCNRGIILNMNHIVNEADDVFTMKSGMMFPIRKRDRIAIKKKYHNYQFKKLEEM